MGLMEIGAILLAIGLIGLAVTTLKDDTDYLQE